MSDTEADAPCSACGDPTPDALSRTVRLSVDRANIDTQRLCPDCFAEWIARYQREMETETDPVDGGGDHSDIIVD
ncbi:hypothetical protein ACFQAS_12435 [Halopenitus salinus]|jgi:hypothetical protein|uniref:Small CPxCG-related zinc finger protein n=1 Tax=Halopenitus salinus TaxID=1198295 RepID=A0ABD5UTB9_9EURY